MKERNTLDNFYSKNKAIIDFFGCQPPPKVEESVLTTTDDLPEVVSNATLTSYGDCEKGIKNTENFFKQITTLKRCDRPLIGQTIKTMIDNLSDIFLINYDLQYN